MIKKDNPAGRLHEIFSKTRGVNANQSIRNVWTNIFQIDDEDTIGMYYNLGILHNTSLEVEQMILRIPSLNHELFLRNMNNIRKALSWPNTHSHWSELRNLLTEQAITDLAYCAEEIDKFYREESIPREDLEEIQIEIDDLFKQVSESEIDLKLKVTLQDLLEAMRRAVAEYNIRGAKGIREVVDYSLGSILRHREEIKKESQSPVIEKFKIFLIKVDNITSKAIKYLPLLEFASKHLLQWGSNDH
jgi:hypothetical protein